MNDEERESLTEAVRDALQRTWAMRNPADGKLWGVLPMIETQLAWCLQQLRMEEHPRLPAGKEMNMATAALREFSRSFGGSDDEYYELILDIQTRFELAATPAE